MNAQRLGALKSSRESGEANEVLVTIQCLAIALVLAVALFHTNMLPVLAAILAAVVAILCQKGWTATFALVLIVASSFGFIGLSSQYQVIECKNGEIVYLPNTSKEAAVLPVAFNPFSDRVRNYKVGQSAQSGNGIPNGPERCFAKTRDQVEVQGYVGATLTLPFGGLPTAHKVAGSQSVLETMIRQELCARFESAIGRYDIAALPSTLTLEARTTENVNGMNRLGVKYSGLIHVGHLHVHVVQR